ncbi:MAG: molybdopterin-dependent oxidoreductase [Myxococcaceae bacterium]
MATHFRACNLCEAMCGIRVETEGPRVLSIRGDDDDPFSRGHICPKVTALQTIYEDPDRLRRPMRRVKNGWEPMAWDAALDFAAEGLHAVQERHGRNTLGLYLGNPTVHNTGALLYASLFAKALRTKHRYSATSVDQLPHMLAAYWMFGHQLMLPIPDVDRAHYFLMLGANPIASNGSLMTAPDIKRRLDEVKARGKLVVVDPRRTETAERASEHLFIRPGTDALFVAALLHEVFREGRVRLGRLGPHVEGVEQLREVVQKFSPARVAGVTGIAADVITRIAKEFSDAPSAVCYGRMGTSTQKFGTATSWLINCLNIVTGHLDSPGGAMFPTPAFDPRTLPKALAGGRGSHGRWKSRVRGLPETGGELPVATLGEDILTPGEGQLRAMVVVCGNPVLSTPNGVQLDKAFASLDFMVSVDPYLNETSRHASIILPTPSPLEREHFDIAFHLVAVRNTVRYAPALFDPGKDARHDWQVMLGLAERLEALRGEGLSARVKWKVTQRLGPQAVLDLGLRLGRYGGLRGLSLKKVARAEHGIDLGALVPVLPEALPAAQKKVLLVPPGVVSDVARLEAELAEAPVGAQLRLINRRHLRDNNSWLHNAPRLVSGPSRCTLLMSPVDAKARGLEHGVKVKVASRVGEVVVPLEVSEAMMPGVVSLPHGYGHSREGVQLAVASAHAGASVNDLSDDQQVDALSGNAAFNGLAVTVLPLPVGRGSG